MLQSVIETQEAIPEGMADYYEEQDGKFLLKVEGLVAKTKVDEFRNTNIAVLKENANLKERLDGYGDLDVEQAREALRFKDDLDTKKLMEKGQFEELLSKQEDKLNRQHEVQVKKLQNLLEVREKEVDTTQRLLNQSVIDRSVTEALDAKPMLTTAARMLLADRAKSTFSVDDQGKIVAKDADGNIRFAKNGLDNYGISEYIEDYVIDYQDDPSFVRPSSGGGARTKEELAFSSAGGVVRLSPQEAKNLSVYKRAKEEAEKSGKRLVIE